MLNYKSKIHAFSRGLMILIFLVFFLAMENLFARDLHVPPPSKSTKHAIQKVIVKAFPGDTVYLGAGEYFEDFHSSRAGTLAAPIRIVGDKGTIIHGAGGARIIQVHHSHVYLEGFTVDGHYREAEVKEAYRNKLIYVVSKEKGKGVTGVKLFNLILRNAGGECVRFRYLAQHNEIAHNRIENCGIYDFRYAGGGKNGEGIYIGSAPEQWGNGKAPDARPDESSFNWIHHNFINTQGNECVDIKERSENNIVEHNVCKGQKDPKSAGFDARGSHNIFKNNTVSDCVGAGFRLGGDGEKDGIENDVMNNSVEGCRAGGVKFQRHPQGKVCGNNIVLQNGFASTGTFRREYQPAQPCK